MMGAGPCRWAVTPSNESRHRTIRLELIGEKREYKMTGVFYFPTRESSMWIKKGHICHRILKGRTDDGRSCLWMGSDRR